MNIVHSFIYLNLIRFALVLIHKFIQASQVAQWRIYPSMQEIQETWVWSLGTLTYNKIKQKRLGSFTNSPTSNICRVIRFGNGSYITIRDQRMDKKCVGFPRDTGLVGSNPMSGRTPGERKWKPTPVFLLENSHGKRSLVGYSPKNQKSWTWLSD